MVFMKSVESYDGFLKIFPNYRHENRTNGLGMSNLSPMKLGPVIHEQPHLPPVVNLGNFHQGNKCFRCEVDINDNPSQVFFQNQYNFYRLCRSNPSSS